MKIVTPLSFAVGAFILHTAEARAHTEAAAEIPTNYIDKCRLTPEEFHTAYPKLRVWIDKTLAFHERNAKPIVSMHFVRLPLYFDRSLLESAKFIVVDQLAMPPLSAMGLSRFAAF